MLPGTGILPLTYYTIAGPALASGHHSPQESFPFLRACCIAAPFLFANHAVSVGVVHKLIGRVSAAYRRDTVGPGLCAGDAAVPVDENRNSNRSVITKSPGSSGLRRVPIRRCASSLVALFWFCEAHIGKIQYFVQSLAFLSLFLGEGV